MKKLTYLLLALMAAISATAQTAYDDFYGEFKIAAGYARDFPGVAGTSITGEYILPLHPFVQAGIGFRYNQLSGYPRTAEVEEYSKGTALDFRCYFLPVSDSRQAIKLGIGYSFSFYRIQRAYPSYDGTSDKTPIWHIQQEQGTLTGISLTGEYEYFLPGRLSIGIRTGLQKVYDQTFFIGPFAGLRL